MTIYDFGFTDPFANGADSSEIEPFPDENRGLGIAFAQTDGKPEMKGLNGLFNKISKSLLSIRQNGVLGWVGDIEYKQGGFVVEGNLLYQAKRNNTSKQPSLSQSDWELWTNASNIAVDANDNITKIIGVNGVITLKVENASILKKGVVQFANNFQVTNKSAENVSITPKNSSDIAQSMDIGINQSHSSPSRQAYSTYTNYSSKPIFIGISLRDSGNVDNVLFYVNNSLVINLPDLAGGNNSGHYISQIIPPNFSYRLETRNPIILWSELS